jgi:hypothetical protein
MIVITCGKCHNDFTSAEAFKKHGCMTPTSPTSTAAPSSSARQES